MFHVGGGGMGVVYKAEDVKLGRFVALTVVATAAFSGLRRGEIRGLLWENYNGQEYSALAWLQDGDVGVGVFPEGQEVLVGGEL